MRIEKCKQCGKAFEANTSVKTCPDCRADKECLICGVAIAWNRKYCSRKCSSEAFIQNKEIHAKISESRKGISTWELMSEEQRSAANAKRQSRYTDEWRSAKSAQSKELMTDAMREHLSNKMHEYWDGNDSEKQRRRDIQLDLYSDEKHLKKVSERTAEALSDPEIRKRMSESGKLRWENMSAEEREAHSKTCADVWTEEKREEARQRTLDYQKSLLSDPKELSRQRKKKLSYWTPERRIQRGNSMRGDQVHAEKIRAGMQRYWASLPKGERARLLTAWKQGSKSNVSAGEKAITDFVKDLMTTYGTGELLLNDRAVLGGRELDLYLPEQKLAIEYNGSFYHSVQHMHKKTKRSINECTRYHQQKSLDCAEQGIHLIHIWDWEWDDVRVRERLKSQVRGALGLSARIFARKCELRELTSKESTDFFSLNSQFGTKGGILVTFGLFFNGECVMAYGLSWKQSGRGSYDRSALEVARSATKLNTVVVGGASRLMARAKEWARTHHPTISHIHYFVDFDKHSGTSVRAMGGEFMGVTPPSIRIIFNTNCELVSKRGDIFKAQQGVIYSRMPTFHSAVKREDERGNLLTLANAGTLHYRFSVD